MSKQKKRKAPYPEDNGYVVAKMNVEGMPWYDRSERNAADQNEKLDLSRRETRAIILNAIAAAALVGGVLAAGVILYVLFCTKIWFA